MSLRFRCALFTLAIAVTPAAGRAGELFQGNLNGAAVNPPTPSPGSGSTAMDYDSIGHTLLVDLSFTGLLGNSTASHIHCCVAPPGNAGVAVGFIGFPPGVTAGAYLHLFDLLDSSVYNPTFLANSGGTAAAAEAALLAAMRSSTAYVVVHSTDYPSGEIRAFLVPALVFADGFESGDTLEWSATVP